MKILQENAIHHHIATTTTTINAIIAMHVCIYRRPVAHGINGYSARDYIIIDLVVQVDIAGAFTLNNAVVNGLDWQLVAGRSAGSYM